MMSYPSFGRETRAQRHPDPVRLAALAESTGTDLRLIVLLRSPVDMVYSTSFKRQFMAPEQQVELLTHEAMVLLEHLRILDPRFYVCFDMNDESTDVCRTIAHHLAWPFGNGADDACKRLAGIHSAARAAHAERTLPSHLTDQMLPFYHADAAIRDMCRHAHAIHDADRAAQGVDLL